MFDEIGSGTAERASAPIATDLLSAFQALKARIIVATHNHALRDIIEQAGMKVNAFHPEILLVRLPDGTCEAESNYSIKPGFPPADVPAELGARRVMSKLGLSPDALKEIVRRSTEKERGCRTTRARLS